MSNVRRRNSEEEMIGEQIQSLIAPPPPDKKEKVKAKGSWKKKNREYCEACLDGGELICCERCPISYHPSCCDPPCDAHDLPDKWVCKPCQNSNTPPLPEKETNPFKVLDAENAHQNPTEFDIDPILATKMPLPGTQRNKTAKQQKTGKLGKRELHEIDQAGLVQLSSSEMIKLCHQCNQSARKAQLIQCDFCPLLFHQDCLTPPLTNIPRSKWMCPAHPEKFFLDSSDLFNSDKIALTNLFSKKVDPDDVIQNLLKKQKSTVNRSLGKIKGATPISKKIKYCIVPPSVKTLYKTYRNSKILKDNPDVSLFIDSVHKLSKDINRNYTIPLSDSDEPNYDHDDPKQDKLLAVLCLVNVNAKPFRIEEYFLKIGTSSSCQVILNDNCDKVSSTHAVIYQDGMQNWEILNYSPFGITVDGIRYGLEEDCINLQDTHLDHCDSNSKIPINSNYEQILDVNKTAGSARLQEKCQKNYKNVMNDRVCRADVLDETEIDSIKERIHSISGAITIKEDKSIAWKSDRTEAKIVRKRKLEKPHYTCDCDSVIEPGWEAAASISHGSVIQIGCHKLMFALSKR